MLSEKWVPEVSKLVARHMVGAGIDEIELGYRDKSDDEWHFNTIAVMRSFSAQTRFGGTIECCNEKVHHTGIGNIIVRDYASDMVLRAFAQLWDCRSNSMTEWLDEVDRSPQLANEEKKRLRQIAQPAN